MNTFFLILINIVLVVVGQTFIKQGMVKIGSFSDMPLLHFFQKSLTSPLVIVSVILYILSSFVWFMVLSKTDLSVAYPALSLGYILILAISLIYLHEPVTLLKIVGTVLISLGVFLIFRK